MEPGAIPLPLDDLPATKDYLKIERYSNALKDMILHPNLRTPLALGIFGRWGTGKTTLMLMLRRALQGEGVATVWFDAWRYDQEEALWAAFLQSILNQVGDDLPLLSKITYHANLIFFHRIDWHVAIRIILKTAFRALAAVLPLILAWPLIQRLWDGIYVVFAALAGGLLTAVLAWWGVYRPLIEAVRKNVTLDFTGFLKEYSYKEHIAFLDKFRQEFKEIIDSLPRKNNVRLVVFIDDLDRCSLDRILQVLDAIKLFVDIPGCFYVLGLDEGVVRQAVNLKYANSPPEERQKYLDKIIQLRFLIPAYSTEEIHHYISNLPYRFQDRGCIDVFASGLSNNPREIKRTINSFAFGKYLFDRHHSGAETLNEILLAKVVVIQHRYPELYEVMRGKPALVKELEAYYQKKEQTGLPDYLLFLDDIFRNSIQAGELIFFAKNFGARGVIPPENAIQVAEEIVTRLDKENRVGEIIRWGRQNWGREKYPALYWDEIARRIETDSKEKTSVPELAKSLLPYRSLEGLQGLFKSGEGSNGAGFAGLAEEKLAAYFSLAREVQILSKLGVDGSTPEQAGAASGSTATVAVPTDKS